MSRKSTDSSTEAANADTSTKRRRRGSGRATLGDVARLANAAPITVSRYVANKESVSRELGERIEAAIVKLDYVPNRIAQGLASASSPIVAAIVPSIMHSIFATTLDVLSKRLQAHGYQLLLGNTSYSREQEEALIRTFLHWSPAALVVVGHSRSAAAQALLERCPVPVVETWDLDPSAPLMQVGFSQIDAARDMALHLRNRGYRRIAYVNNGLADDVRSRVRERGCREALDAHGQETIVTIATGESPLQAGRDALVHLLRMSPRPDAIFFANDNLAAGALLEAQRRGLRVPEDVAIAGFGDFPIAAMLTPSLTTIAPPVDVIGEATANLLLARFGHIHPGEMPGSVIDVGYQLLAREST
ncbi:LacI family DNA-binding transcriptional regulator [Niveibacterium sp.]|uniref:LacI family DNA-binding transcriptional regulator n=1 Tax=Niveibacterium sp. TaxID=2017444 RepID=UPI0035ADA34D